LSDKTNFVYHRRLSITQIFILDKRSVSCVGVCVCEEITVYL